jgi:hypothetical protein
MLLERCSHLFVHLLHEAHKIVSRTSSHIFYILLLGNLKIKYKRIMAPSAKPIRSRCVTDESEDNAFFLHIDHSQFQPLDEIENYGAHFLPLSTSCQCNDSQIFRENKAINKSIFPKILMANPLCLARSVDDEDNREDQGRSPLTVSSAITCEETKESPKNVEYAVYNELILDWPLIHLEGSGYQLPFFR